MTEPFTRLQAVALPLLRDNVNTDAIIPSREIKSVSRKGLADGLFADWRYRQPGGREPDPGFVLNGVRYAGAQILLAGTNFGCGSSREHAAWALREYGFRAIIAASFNAIFRGNAVLNGIVPVVLARGDISLIAAQISSDDEATVIVDLEAMQVVSPLGERFAFELDGEARDMLWGGLDSIDLTSRHRAVIERFRQLDEIARPWAYQCAASGSSRSP